jgi:hypothetical protein
MHAKAGEHVPNQPLRAELEAQRRNLESGVFACEFDDVEVVDELAPLQDFTLVMDCASPFALFLSAMKDVAATRYGAAFEQRDQQWLVAPADAIGRAWHRVLRGETNDLRIASGMLLDEWAAGAIASAFEDPSAQLALRRELRARGVCAFGVLESG